jgi:DNA modification methylase
MSELYYGKWEVVLPMIANNSIKLIYTDPPYGKKYISNIPGDKAWKKSDGTSQNKFKEHLMNDENLEMIDWAELAKQFFRILKDDSYFVLHCDLNMIMNVACHFLDAGFRTKGQIIWRKNSAVGGDTKGAMKRDYEPILYFCKGKGRLNPIDVERKGEMVQRDRISETDDWTFPLPKKEKRGFPTQKPVRLAEQIIRLTTEPGDIVLDCFAGSGTTPFAAQNLGREYIAVEMDEKWVKGYQKDGKFVEGIEHRLGVKSELVS